MRRHWDVHPCVLALTSHCHRRGNPPIASQHPPLQGQFPRQFSGLPQRVAPTPHNADTFHLKPKTPGGSSRRSRVTCLPTSSCIDLAPRNPKRLYPAKTAIAGGFLPSHCYWMDVWLSRLLQRRKHLPMRILPF